MPIVLKENTSMDRNPYWKPRKGIDMGYKS